MKQAASPDPQKDEVFIVDPEKQEIRTTEQIRQGHTGDHVRYILRISTVAAIIGIALVALIMLR